MIPDPFLLATVLARPVVRGDLSEVQAQAALVMAAVRQSREGVSPPQGDLTDRLRLATAILDLCMTRYETERERVSHLIDRATRPLIEMLMNREIHRGRVRSEAHQINAENGLPFAEDEVETVLLRFLRSAVARQRSLAPPVRKPRRRHG